ncbi:unnamed protein product [Spirodela intermedia]|uniref:SBP-type domain-containing protein n=1 Tax=Spirodela intermedia TaxID=51605 RepID=A0A7I8JNP9_SPIIN|nr:unnamed protein product [Spirodela intermedia]CAA6671203.1 unnamed protein product [Spirodela intermedia]
MDWNPRPSSHWDWESLGCPMRRQWGIGDGSLCSSAAVGFCSGCDLGNGCSPKSSTSTSIDFAMKDLARADHARISADMVESVGSAEPFIGLRLVKRCRASQQGEQISRCQVEGCDLDLTSAKNYHRKHRVCESHSKCPKVIVAGRECRFCQQCSRFHHLSEFDQKKRSCRRRLSDHNARRRKPPQARGSHHRTMVRISAIHHRLQMDPLLSQSPFSGVGTTNPLWESSFDINLMQAKGSSPHFPTNGSLMAVSTPHHNFRQLLPFKSTTTQVLNQGLEATSDASNLDGAPDFRRALSLLSTNSCGSADPGEASPIDLFAHLNNAEAPRVRPFAAHGDGNQFQEFHLLKAPYGNALFDSTRSLYSEKVHYSGRART